MHDYLAQEFGEVKNQASDEMGRIAPVSLVPRVLPLGRRGLSRVINGLGAASHGGNKKPIKGSAPRSEVFRFRVATRSGD